MVYLTVVCYLVNYYMVKLVIPDKLILVSVEYIVSFIPQQFAANKMLHSES